MRIKLWYFKKMGIPPLTIAALLLVQLLFGFQYVVSKYILQHFPAILWANLRCIGTAALFFSACLFVGKLDMRGALRHWKPLLLFSLLGTSINQTCFLYGLTFTTATNSALLNTLIPVFTLVIVSVTGQEKFCLPKMIGFLIALSGALNLHRIENFTLSNQTFVGDLLTMLNSFCYSLFLAFSKPFLKKVDGLWATSWFFIYGSFTLSLVTLGDWHSFIWPPFSPGFIGAIVFSIIGGTFVTYLLVNYAIVRTSSSDVALFIYLQPIIAGGLGWYFLSEEITLRKVISATLIFAGVTIVVRTGNQKSPKEELPQRSHLRVA